MSSPRRRSTSRPSIVCELGGKYLGTQIRLTSIIVNELLGRYKSASRICALCTRPRIFVVPTPPRVRCPQTAHQRDTLIYHTSVFTGERKDWRTRTLLHIRDSLYGSNQSRVKRKGQRTHLLFAVPRCPQTPSHDASSLRLARCHP